jgi:hypothetical protein
MPWSLGCQLFRDSCTAVHRGGGRLALAFATLALLGSAGSARASDSPIPTPRLNAVGSVRAGEIVEIRWGDLPLGVDEMELVLSVDGGRHYPIRISAEMSGRENSFRWRIPNLGVREARVRLRAHHDLREVESGPSDEFSILADPTRPTELEQLNEGEWWDGFGSFDVDTDVHGLAGTRPAFHNLAGGTDSEAPPRGRLLPAPIQPETPAPAVSAARAESSPELVSSAAPLFRPRRE